MNAIEVHITDLEDVRQILAACHTYFTARDVEQAQVDFRAVRSSPLTAEIERVRARFDGYMGDLLLARHESELEETASDTLDDNAEAEEGSQELTEASEEDELVAAPLKFDAPKQRGRRLTKEEVKGE